MMVKILPSMRPFCEIVSENFHSQGDNITTYTINGLLIKSPIPPLK